MRCVQQAVCAGRWHERVIKIERTTSCISASGGPDPAVRRAVAERVATTPRSARFSSGARTRSRSSSPPRRAFRRRPLIIDTAMREAIGETLQASAGRLRRSAWPAPGQADLTAHVDFSGPGAGRRGHARTCAWPLGQGEFCAASHRAARGGAQGRRAAGICRRDRAALARLTMRTAPGWPDDQAVALANAGLEALPGFEPER